MHLFLLGLNLSKEHFEKMQKGDRNLFKIYPELNKGEEFIYKSQDCRNIVISISSPKDVSFPRNYISVDKDHIMLYSGLPIDPSRNISAHNADSILKNFDQIKYSFEGQASLVRFNKHTNDADIITDTLGMEQVFYCFQNGGCLLSNNIGLIENIVGRYSFDPIAAALYVSVGWIPCDYTLRKEIKLIRGGQHWIWSGSEKTFNKNIYFEPIEMKPNSKEVLNKEAIHELYEDLAGYLSILGENFDLQCPLTGGFDSRLIATLLVDQKLNAKYYTSGNPNHAEVKIASMVANKLNLPHQVYQIDYNSLLKNWDDLVKNLILNKNGLASLWSIIEYFLFQTSNSKTHSDGIIFTSDKIPVRLSTMAAEATRAAYNRAFLFSDDVDQAFVYDYLFGQVLANQNEILNDNAIEVFNNYFKKFFKIYIEKGVYYKFMPDIFFLIERVGRHHANKWGLNKNISDFFSMFCSKRYLNAALKIHPVEKTTFPIHYRMMKMLNKEIFSIPFLQGKWPVQNKAVKTFLDKTKPTLKKYVEPLKRKYGRMKSNNGNKFKGEDIQVFDRYMIFNSKLEEIRSVCLDQSSSEIWQFIKKDKLEQILTGKCKIETPMLTQLYAIATVFYYQHFSQQKNGGN